MPAPQYDAPALQALAAAYLETSELNTISADMALRPELAGMRIFDAPLLAVASADDSLFEELKKPAVIGGHVMAPKLWLEGAQSVISFFLPFSERVIQSNTESRDWPSQEWLHARVEGQAMTAHLAAYLRDTLQQAGWSSVAPILDMRFWRHNTPTHTLENGELFLGFTTNWSERHVGYIAGLGTFGLSAGLITAKGMAGRIGSLVTSLEIEPTPRPYSRIDAYCIHCGACISRCPAAAISPSGKDHIPCGALMDRTRAACSPRFGCGKCQVAVPCAQRAPGRQSLGQCIDAIR